MAFRKRLDALSARSSCRETPLHPPGLGILTATPHPRIAQDPWLRARHVGGSVASLCACSAFIPTFAPDHAHELLRADCGGFLADCHAEANCPSLSMRIHGSMARAQCSRTVQETDGRGPPAGLTIEDTLLPQGFWQDQDAAVISLEEGSEKMKAACSCRSDPSLVVLGRNGSRVDHLARRREITRAQAMRPTGPSMRGSSPPFKRAPQLEGDLADDAVADRARRGAGGGGDERSGMACDRVCGG